jgi:hypothetical protein
LYDPKTGIRQAGVIGVQDGSLRILKSGAEGLGMGGFSSDGRYLVYTRGLGDLTRSHIISADGNSEIP